MQTAIRRRRMKGLSRQEELGYHNEPLWSESVAVQRLPIVEGSGVIAAEETCSYENYRLPSPVNISRVSLSPYTEQFMRSCYTT